MTEASVSPPRLLGFVVLCVVVGPIFGTLVELSWAAAGIHNLPFNARLIGALLYGGYMIGAPIALVASVLFGLTARRLNRQGLGAAHLAALIAAVVVGLGLLVWSLVNKRFQPSVLWGVPRMAIIGMVAITGCWYIARAIGMLR